MTKSRVALIVVLVFCNVGFISSQQVEAAFRSSGIVKDVLDRAPSDLLQVTYENATVNMGFELTPTQVWNRPNVSWPVYANSSGTYYTLIMTDPDAPSRADPSLGEVKHWIVGNIRGNDITTGQTIADYIGSAPPIMTGHHRYVFLAYLQPALINYSQERYSSNRTLDNRLNFQVRRFAQQYNLGLPTAGNFYIAQYDATTDAWWRLWNRTAENSFGCTPRPLLYFLDVFNRKKYCS